MSSGRQGEEAMLIGKARLAARAPLLQQSLSCSADGGSPEQLSKPREL